MNIETGLQVAFAIQFAVYGLAHMLRPAPLIQFHATVASKGEGGVIIIALLCLVTGSFLVPLHNIWSGLPMVLTVFGWAQLLKGITYFLFPSFGLRQLQRVTPEREHLFRLPGIPFLVFSALLAWHLMQSS